MADLTARIKPKKSSTAGEVPQASDLEVAELAVNTADGKLFVKHTDNSIKEISGGGASNIVDQGDYSPRYVSADPAWFLSTTFTNSTQFTGDGQGFLTGGGTVYVYLRKVDADGIDRTSQLMGLQIGDSLTFSWNGGANTNVKDVFGEAPTEYTDFVRIRVNNSTESWSDNQRVEISGGTLSATPTEVPKATGDLLTWNSVTGKFEPTPKPADTGISIPDVGRYYNFPTKDADTTPSTAGSWSDRTNQIGLNITDANGVRLNGPKMLSLKTGDKVWLNLDNAGWVEKTLTGNMTYSTSGGGFYYFSLGESVSSYTTVQFAIEPPVLQDGMMLEYVAANTQWEHAYGGRPKSRFAVYEYDSGSATPAPTTGIFCFWSGANYAINQTDFRGTFHGGRLLASPTSFDVKVYASGSLVYDGTISSLANVNSNRATFSFGSNAWVANLIDGQLVEFYSDAFDGGEYYANKGDVKVHDGTDFEARPLFTYNLADVNGAAANNEILKYNSANGGYEPSLPALSDNSDYAFGKALFGSYTYNASAGSIPSVGLTDAYSGSNWAVNVVDNLGVNHQTALYAQTATTNVDIYVDGVFQVSTTISTWGNKNNSRCTFLIGDDTWKTSLTGGELIEFYGEPFTSSDVANSNGQVLAWNSTLSAFQPTSLSASDLSDVDTSPVVASPAQPYNTYDSNWPTVTQGEWSGNGTDKTRIYLHRLDANGNEFEPLATVGTGKEVQIRFQTGSTDYGWVTYVVDVTTIDGDIKQMVMVSPSTHPEAPGNYNSIEVRALVQTPATDGQLLAWNGTASAFQPTTPSISALSDVNPVTYAQGYQVTQGNFANAGEFALNGSGLIFDFRSQNGLGNIPQPQDNGSLWFSTSEFGPFTELKIVGNIGLTGSFAYSIGDFVDRSPLDAVLTGSTVIYWHTVDPSAGPSDGQVLTYVAANGQWEPATPSGSIQTADDFELNPGSTDLTWSTCLGATTISNDPAGSWGAFESGGDTTISIEEASDQGDVTAKLQAIQVNDVIAVNGTNRTVVAKSDFLALQGEMRLTFDGVGYIDNTAGANTLTLSAAQFATGTTPLVDGDILQYVAADSAFKPAKIPVDSNVTQAGTGANAINNLVTISQVDYDALGTPDANTVYFII